MFSTAHPNPSPTPSPTPSLNPSPSPSRGPTPTLPLTLTLIRFPTTHRGVALGLCSTSARFGGVAAPAVLHIGHIYPALPWVLLSAVSFLASAWAAMELPETRGAPLPETLEDCHVPHKAKIRQAE